MFRSHVDAIRHTLIATSSDLPVPRHRQQRSMFGLQFSGTTSTEATNHAPSTATRPLGDEHSGVRNLRRPHTVVFPQTSYKHLRAYWVHGNEVADYAITGNSTCTPIPNPRTRIHAMLHSFPEIDKRSAIVR